MKVLFTIHCSLFISVAFISCSELDDYNSEPNVIGSEENTTSVSQTLWQNIQSHPQLQDFARLVEKSGYASELQSSKIFTVWAPLDGTYTTQSLEAMTSEELLKQFVKNHIASYDHLLKSGQEERIHTLNKKSFDFNEQYYGDQQVKSLNLPASNGVLHTIEGQQHFYPNLYEYLTTTTGIDSVQAYFKRFEYSRLDENASVLGPVVGGRQTYIDSVIVTNNRLFSSLRAQINNEDSNYIAVLPTDTAWKKAYNRIRPYFRYANKTVTQDLSKENPADLTRNLNGQMYGDSLARRAIMTNIFFNANNYWNRWVSGDPEAETTDSLYSTGYALFDNGPEILSQKIDEEIASNGVAYKVDSLAYHSSSWAPEIMIGGNTSSYRPKVQNATADVVRLDLEDINEDKGSFIASYLDLKPIGTRSLPDVFFYLPNVLSTTYEILAIIVPADIAKNYTGEVKPNKFKATLTYNDANGNKKTLSLGTKFVNDPTIVDWVSLGTVSFPIAYRGIGNYFPNLEIKTNIDAWDDDEMATYDRELRIAAIVLKPVENN